MEVAKPNYLERIKLEKEEEEKEKNQALMADQQEITSNVFILFLFLFVVGGDIESRLSPHS